MASNYVFDEDLIIDVLIPIKRGTLSINSIKIYSMGLPVILMIGSNFIDVIVLVYLFYWMITLSFLVVFYFLLFQITASKKLSFIGLLSLMILNPFHSTLVVLDDNILPLVFIFSSYLILMQDTITPKRMILSGFFSLLALFFHFEMVQYVVLIPIFILIKHQTSMKQKLISITLNFLPIIITLIPIITWYFMNNESNGFELSSYAWYFQNGEWYLFANNDLNLKSWGSDWLYAIILAFSPFKSIFLSNHLDGSTIGLVKFGLFIMSCFCFIFIFVIPNYYFFKKKSQLTKYSRIIVINNIGFIITSVSTFIYDKFSYERWTLGIIYVTINFVIFLNTIKFSIINRISMVVTINGKISDSKPLKVLILTSFLMCILMISNLASIASTITNENNYWPYPQASVIEEVNNRVPRDSPLLVSTFWHWRMLSYHRDSWITYITWNDNNLDIAIYSENAIFNQIQLEPLITKINSFLQQNTVVYFIDLVIPMIQFIGLENRTSVFDIIEIGGLFSSNSSYNQMVIYQLM
ncbi:MAG: hypothetical protein OEY49_12210 [Candidatus Heimdallarchaeota archaeon]|nr:hypothetical protein [Candidatus Heimdallarchaeota archaeon]